MVNDPDVWPDEVHVPESREYSTSVTGEPLSEPRVAVTARVPFPGVKVAKVGAAGGSSSTWTVIFA